MSQAFIRVLQAYGEPVNRDTYLNTAWAGQPPTEISGELEAEFPENDARFMESRPTTHEEVAARTQRPSAPSSL